MASPRLSPLTFDDLAHRLVRDLAKLIHGGAVTERKLAAMVGLSQSHLHNVVNGLRTLTPNVADQIMERLDWSLLDFVESAEAQALLSRREASLARGREISLADLVVGKRFSSPGVELKEISVPHSWLARTENPVAVSVGGDDAMDSVMLEGDIALLDAGRAARSEIRPDALYAVRVASETLARWLRLCPRGLYLVTARDWSKPICWPLIVAPPSRRAEIVEGRIIALARPPDGTFRRPVPPSASS